MNSPVSNPRAVISINGDVLIIPGASLVLFVPRTHIGNLLEARPQSSAILIEDVGAAAVATFLAAGATFDACTQQSAVGEIESVTIRFALPNGIACVWTTDESLASDRSRLKTLGIDLAVTNSTVTWERKHAGLIGEMISAVPRTPPQLVSLQSLNPDQLAQLVRDAQRFEEESTDE